MKQKAIFDSKDNYYLKFSFLEATFNHLRANSLFIFFF